ncbi:MAG TPA: glycosyltransferase family 4 protein [Vicinamibacteria bacterium]|nr:glycosyltransferase family 4 protein [Vicinamibacteria bacterium]
MKILMLTSSYPKYPGDVTAPFIESIARGVAARGHAVDVVLPHHPELRRPPGEPVRFFPYRYAPDRLSLWGYAQSMAADVRVRRRMYLLLPFVTLALRRLVAERLEALRYDALHVHWVVPSAVLVADMARSHALPLVVSLHGSDVFVAERHRPAGWAARSALHSAGAVTACSRDLYERALRLGAPPARTRTLPYGVEVAAFTRDALDPGIRARLGGRPGELLVLAFGRLVEKKGFRYLIEAAAAVQGVRVAVAGQGDLRGELETLARELRSPVVFAGPLERDAMAHAVLAADVVVVPSVVDRAGNVDGLPNALLEALAAGRAVVASRVAGIPDVVADGETGLLTPPRDVAALAAALSRLRDDPSLRDRLGLAARRAVAESLSWDAAARAFEDCYRQAIAHAG